ncbi:MAG: SPASM domain-containing protein, partial [Deltaproteobacteria bacterium]|nr:SPASM domain-containing protein [Deltaproteobacteria bacterium]
EPLLREDWEALTSRLQARGVRVNTISNGWLTAERSMVQRIKDAGLTTFALSVDGLGEKHDEIRCRPGSFARILRSYELAAQVGGLTLAAVTTVTRLCIDDLEQLYHQLLDSGVRLWQLQVCTAQGRMQRDDPILPGPRDLLRLADFIVEKKAEGKMRLDPADNIGYYGPWELQHGFRSTQWGRVNFWSGCQAGCQVMGIDANGDIKGCLSLPSDLSGVVEGNVRAQSLAEIWWKPGGFAYNRQFSLAMLEGACRSCTYRGLCRAGCVSHAICSSGSRGCNPSCLLTLLAGGSSSAG